MSDQDADKTEGIENLETEISSEAPTRVQSHRPAPQNDFKNSDHKHPGSMYGDQKVLKDRFVLESVIGRGGMGVVYKALDLRKKEMGDREPYVAIKLISANLRELKDDESLIALQREAKKAQKLAHPNVATVYDFDRDGDEAFLCMELLEGEPLSDFLKRYVNRGMSFEEALPIIQGMARGLAYAHDKNIVHSDFKPGNVFVTKTGEVKILDFGIARAFTRDDQGSEQTVFDPGSWDAITPSYASPEMFYRMDPDPRDDIYALGCVCYELLCGTHPYDRQTAVQAIENKSVPPSVSGLNRHVNALLAESIALTRNDRTLSIVEFLDGIQPRNEARGRSGIKLGLIAFIVAVLAVGVFLAFKAQEGAQAQQTSVWLVEEQDVGMETAQKIDRLMAVAESHASIGRYISPPTSNAAEVYVAILKLQPGNRNAIEATNAIANAVVKKADTMIGNGQKVEAVNFLEEAVGAMPDHPLIIKKLREIK